MTSIHVVLDRSGSMYECLSDTLGGFNHFIEKQKSDNPSGTVTLNLFAHDYDTVYENTPIEKVQKLTTDTYFPRGQTALLDAIGNTIKKIETQEKPMVVIITDGYENASTKFTHAHVKDLISTKESLGWNFVFLGANQDAIKVGGVLGIPEESAMTFDTKNIYNAFEGLSCAVGRQVSGQEETVAFTGLERTASQPTPGSPMSTSEVFTGLARC